MCDIRPAPQFDARPVSQTMSNSAVQHAYTPAASSRDKTALVFVSAAASGKCTESFRCSKPARNSSPAPTAASSHACRQYSTIFDASPTSLCCTCTTVLLSRMRMGAPSHPACCNPLAPSPRHPSSALASLLESAPHQQPRDRGISIRKMKNVRLFFFVFADPQAIEARIRKRAVVVSRLETTKRGRPRQSRHRTNHVGTSEKTAAPPDGLCRTSSNSPRN